MVDDVAALVVDVLDDTVEELLAHLVDLADDAGAGLVELVQRVSRLDAHFLKQIQRDSVDISEDVAVLDFRQQLGGVGVDFREDLLGLAVDVFQNICSLEVDLVDEACCRAGQLRQPHGEVVFQDAELQDGVEAQLSLGRVLREALHGPGLDLGLDPLPAGAGLEPGHLVESRAVLRVPWVR